MGTVKARDYFKTEYLCAHHAFEIEELCEKLGDDVLDMAGMKIVEYAMTKLSMMIKDHNVTVIDSFNERRNDLFKQAKERRGLSQMENVKTKALPRLDQLEDMKSYLASLDKDVLYTIDLTSSDERYYCPLVSLISFYRPAIQIETSMVFHTLAAYICSYLYRRPATELLREDKEYTLVLENTTFDIMIPTDDVDEKFELVGLGKFTFQELVNKYYIIPSKFGRVALAKNDPHEFWKKFQERVWSDMHRYFINGKQSLENFLGI